MLSALTPTVLGVFLLLFVFVNRGKFDKWNLFNVLLAVFLFGSTLLYTANYVGDAEKKAIEYLSAGQLSYKSVISVDECYSLLLKTRFTNYPWKVTILDSRGHSVWKCNPYGYNYSAKWSKSTDL